MNMCKIELDNCFSKRQALHVGNMVNNRFDMDGFIVSLSSIKTHVVRNEEGDRIIYKYRTRGYHIVWNREVTSDENRAVKSWIYLHIKKQWDLISHLDDWIHMQEIKQTDTLRHGFKGKKKPPKIVYRFGNQDKQIAEFLDNRQYILDFLNDSAG